MAVNVNNGSLNFVSTLDNSDFQKKSLQDIQLIKLRLELEGDTAGLERYNQAVKNSLTEEISLRKELDKVLKQNQITPPTPSAPVTPSVSKTQFSDSAAEVAAYQAALNGLETGVGIIANLNAQLDDLNFEQERLTASFNAGSISEAEYVAATELVNAEQARLIDNIKRVNDAYSTNVLVQNENTAATTATTVAVQEELGVLEALKITLADLKRVKITASATDLPIINRQIQETEAEIVRFSNIGRVGFDRFGQAVQENVTRSGNYLTQGFGYIRKLAYILPGIGVAGIIGFATGPIIEYVSNLNILSVKLNQAKANLEAYNAVNKNANKDASSQISTLKLLYQTTQDVTVSIEKRVAAAQQLRELFPEEFAHATDLAIVNGKLKTSYDDLTLSIIANAKSTASLNRITEEENKILDQQFIIDKNNAIKAAETQRALAAYRAQLARVDKSPQEQAAINQGLSVYKTQGGTFLTPLGTLKEQLRQITDLTNRSNVDPSGLIKQSNSTVNFLTQFVKNVNKAGTDLEDANKLLGKNFEFFDQLLSNAGDEKDLQNIKNALQVKLNALAPNDPQIAAVRQKLQKVDDLLKEYQVKATKTSTGDPAIALLASQTKILQDIDALNEKYVSKAKTKDEQEVDAVVANYTKMYDAIKAQNVKYTEYIKTHSASEATKKGLQFIDPTVLNAQEITALQALGGTQSVEATKNQIDQQKALFSDYENFKLQAGTQAANELFSKQLQGFTKYIDYLKSFQPTESDLNSVDPYIKARAAGLKDFLSVEIPKANTEELSAQQKHLQDLVISYQDYQQRRETLIEKANENIKALNDKGFTDQAKQAKQTLEDTLTQLDEENFKKLDAAKDLFNNIDTLSQAEGKKLIDELRVIAQAAYLEGNITAEAFGRITKSLNQANNSITDKIPAGLKNIGSELQNIGSQVSDFDEGLGKVLNTIGSVLTGVASIKENFNQIAKTNADSALSSTQKAVSNLGSYGAIISAVVSIGKAIYGFFDNSKAKAEQAKYSADLQLKAIQAVNKGLERQLELTKQIYGPERISGYLKQLQDIQKAQKAAQDQINGRLSLSGNKSVDALIDVGNNGDKGSLNFIAIQLEKQLGHAVELTGKSLNDLENLLDAGKLDARTSAIVQSLIDLQNQATATQNALTEDLTGTSFENLADSIVNLFESATTSAQDFATNFQKIIQTGLLNAFKRQFLEKQLQGFYDDFYTLSSKATNNVLSAEDIAKLKAEYDTIIANASEQFKNIQAATGIVFGSSSSPNSLAGSIQASLTEDTASILAGTLKGIQLGVYDTNRNLTQLTLIAQETLNVALQIQINTLRTANNSDRLPEMLAELKGINLNTQGSLSIDLRAAGFYKY